MVRPLFIRRIVENVLGAEGARVEFGGFQGTVHLQIGDETSEDLGRRLCGGLFRCIGHFQFSCFAILPKASRPKPEPGNVL